MAWFPNKGIIRKLRIERRWTAEELARKAGVKPRTVYLWESDQLPRTGHDDTVRGFAHAFGVKNEEIARWGDHDPDRDDGDDAPARSTLAARASRDGVRECAVLPDGDRIELMRPRLFHRIGSAPGLCVDQKYSLAGKLRDHRDMPAVVARVLGYASPVCSQFLFVRQVHNGEIFYASAFSTTAEQTAQLLDAAEKKEKATVVVSIKIVEPDKNKDFKGFFVFQKKGETPKIYKWCFTIDRVIVGDLVVELEAPAVEKPKKPKTAAKKPRVRGGEEVASQ